jgi:hypothetical protein
LGGTHPFPKFSFKLVANGIGYISNMDTELLKTTASTISTAFLIKEAGGKELIVKLLGPTADYLGQSSRFLVEKGIGNVDRMLKYAISKSGKNIDDGGQVPPRILKDIIGEAAYCENEFMSEYYGGLLAASRTENSNDDKTVSFTKLVGSMSTMQVRAHYVIYLMVRKINLGRVDINIGASEGRNQLKMYIPFSIFQIAMGCAITSSDLAHIMFGLNRLNLIEPVGWQYGQTDVLKKVYPDLNEAGIILVPSALGAELFLLAHGCVNETLSEIFDEKLKLKMKNVIDLKEGAINLSANKS